MWTEKMISQLNLAYIPITKNKKCKKQLTRQMPLST